MIVDVDEMGTAFGKWMRFQPNGRSRKNHIAKLKKISFASGNSYAPRAITSDWIDAGSQSSYHPQPIWSGELKLGPIPNNWRIGASGTCADVYGELRKNPEGGRINNIKYYRSKILIKSFMPEDALWFRRGLEKLSECHQIMLWAHYVLVVVSPSKLKELREQEKLTCYQVTYQQKLGLLQTTNDRYPKWLGLSRRAIAKEIERLDIELSFKKSPPKSAKGRNKGSTGPLWSCRIFASIHKFPIRHSNVEDLLPVSFSPQGIRNPRTQADYLPAGKSANQLAYMYFRQPTGEIYSVLSPIDLKRLRRKGELDSFLDKRRENAANFTNFDINEWHPVIWHPGWIKPIPQYNTPIWLEKRGLTNLYERAEHWAEELLNEPEKEHLWKRGGRELGWYL